MIGYTDGGTYIMSNEEAIECLHASLELLIAKVNVILKVIEPLAKNKLDIIEKSLLSSGEEAVALNTKRA